MTDLTFFREFTPEQHAAICFVERMRFIRDHANRPPPNLADDRGLTTRDVSWAGEPCQGPASMRRYIAQMVEDQVGDEA